MVKLEKFITSVNENFKLFSISELRKKGDRVGELDEEYIAYTIIRGEHDTSDKEFVIDVYTHNGASYFFEGSEKEILGRLREVFLEEEVSK